MRILKRTQKTLPAVLLAAACSQRPAFLLRCQPEKRQDVKHAFSFLNMNAEQVTEDHRDEQS